MSRWPYDRAGLIRALDKLHEEGCLMGWTAASDMATALGWEDKDEWPDGQWIRGALHEVLQ